MPAPTCLFRELVLHSVGELVLLITISDIRNITPARHGLDKNEENVGGGRWR